jgi:subtilisin family serine protease
MSQINITCLSETAPDTLLDQQLILDPGPVSPKTLPDPLDKTLKEYIVVVKKSEDVESFYLDMESPDDDLYIPNRKVDIVELRPMSNSTHYMLTEYEAGQIRKDPRVKSVEMTLKDKGFKIQPLAKESSDNWNKSSVPNANDKNWGLYRCFIGTKVPDWGSDKNANASGDIFLTNSGRNVDVVICDGHIDPNHPEFAVNPDGTGGSRVIRYNWFQHNIEVRNIDPGTYEYVVNPNDPSDNHGTHVAGIACGNTQGWAKSANIYNISPYANHPNENIPNWNYYVLDYIRAFHKTKPINPNTGVKNPTIINLSWGATGSADLSKVDNVKFQGTTFPPQASPWSSYRAMLGLIAADSSGQVVFMVRDDSIDVDAVACISDGIILVGAAGNYFMYNDVPGGKNYDNALRNSQTQQYTNYMRGPSPGAAPGVISVSAVGDLVDEKKPDYSNAGPRTDIFAPGSSIMSSYITGGVPDPRNSSFNLAKSAGTSMACPQVAGILACVLESYPNLKQSDALKYIQAISSKDQLSNPITLPTFPFMNFNSLLSGPNIFVKYKKERLDSGKALPKTDFKTRPNKGLVYPRINRKIFK